MTTNTLWALDKPLGNLTHYSLKHLHRNSCDFLLNSMFQLLKSVGCWSVSIPEISGSLVTHSGDAQNGVDFFQWPLSLPQYSPVYVFFLDHHLLLYCRTSSLEGSNANLDVMGWRKSAIAMNPNSLRNSRWAITKLSPFSNAFTTKARCAPVHGSIATKTL